MALPTMIEAYKYTKNMESWSRGLPTTVTEIYIPSLNVIVNSDGFCEKTHHFSEKLETMIKIDFPEDLGNKIALFANNIFQNFVNERTEIRLALKSLIANEVKTIGS